MNKMFLFIAGITYVMCTFGISSISISSVQAQDSLAEHRITEKLPIINEDSVTQLDAYDRISFKIRGIDYSTAIAQILITVDGKTYAQNINPIALLDPHDDDAGIIQFEMLIPKGAMKSGSTYTSCIKILEDTDNYGTKLACQTGSTDDIHTLSGENNQIYLKI